MKHLIPLLGLLLWLPALPARAGASIAYGSSVGAVNLNSDGSPLDGRFSFEIGCFAPGFVPTRSNTSEWLSRWQAFPEGTAPYRTAPLGDPFPSDSRMNSFGGSIRLTENPAPFAPGVPVYLWGFDRRTMAGKAEWILITDSSWVCPDGQGMNPSLSYAVAHATRAIVGNVNDDGIQMRTAAVALSGTPESLASWRTWHFGAETTNPSLEPMVWGSLADPDHDRRPNLMEYFLGSDPRQQDEEALVGPVYDAGDMVLHYRRSLLARDAGGGIEWSANLQQWTSAGLTETVVHGDETSATIEARLTAPPAGGAFFRLKAEQ